MVKKMEFGKVDVVVIGCYECLVACREYDVLIEMLVLPDGFREQVDEMNQSTISYALLSCRIDTPERRSRIHADACLSFYV